MRKLPVILLIAVLGASLFVTLTGQTFAQEPTEQPEPTETTPPPLIIRWMRFRGAITQWGDEPYHGSVTVRTKTANRPPDKFKPWVTVTAVWSNEQRPIASDPKPVGEVTFTHYRARLIRLISLKGKLETANLEITGIWNVSKITITTEFDENGDRVNTVREKTPVVSKVEGQLRITDGWKKFTIEIEGIDPITGIEKTMRTTRRMMHRFSFRGDPAVTITDLFNIVRRFRAMPGFGDYDPELDFNSDSQIDIADLTTVAASM